MPVLYNRVYRGSMATRVMYTSAVPAARSAALHAEAGESTDRCHSNAGSYYGQMVPPPGGANWCQGVFIFAIRAAVDAFSWVNVDIGIHEEGGIVARRLRNACGGTQYACSVMVGYVPDGPPHAAAVRLHRSRSPTPGL